MSAPAWETAPHWAKWVAMDSNGEWYWFSDEPVQSVRAPKWMPTQGLCALASPELEEWSESKQQRPAESWPKGEAP